MTTVIHIRDAPPGWESNPDYAYIGRKGKGHDGYFGNPFGRPPGAPLGSTLGDYYQYLHDRMDEDQEFRHRVLALKGKTLVCFCRPKDGFKGNIMCHGQVLVGMLDGTSPCEVQ